MKTSIVLRRARAIIDKPEKWGKYGYMGGPTQRGRCVIVALVDARGGFATTDPGAKQAFADAAGTDQDYGLACWNDAPDRTHADVMAAFDRAIVVTEASEASTEAGEAQEHVQREEVARV